MTGTLLNAIAIVAGGLIGLFIKSRLPEALRKALVTVLGLFTVGLGIKLFLGSGNVLIVLFSLLAGALVGELSQLERRFEQAGERLQAKAHFMGSDHQNFSPGFLSASLLFVIGPVAILGALQDGLSRDYSLLAVKSVMDFVASIALASTLGAGVIASAVPVLLYQGTISLMAVALQGILGEAVINEITATGGLILLGIGLRLLVEIKALRPANLLPALVMAPVIMGLFTLFGLR